jgi:hypothetical protein
MEPLARQRRADRPASVTGDGMHGERTLFRRRRAIMAVIVLATA